MTEDQRSLLFHVAAESAGISSSDLSAGEMRIAETLVDGALCFFDLTLRLTERGWAALESADA